MASSSRAKNTASQGTIIDLFDDLGMSHTKFTTTYADGGRLAALKKYEQFFVQLLELTQRPTKAVLKAAAVKSCRVSPHSAKEFAQKEAKAVRQAAKLEAVAAKTIDKTAERLARRIEKEATEAAAKVVKMKAKEDAIAAKRAAKQADTAAANAIKKKEKEEAKAAKRAAAEAAASAANAAKQTAWYEGNCARHKALAEQAAEKAESDNWNEDDPASMLASD